jgi:transcriptional regulator with XRE-family HTH domain
MTQKALAMKLDIAYATLNKYEKGHRLPDALLLGRIASVLDCDPGWLLSGRGEMSPNRGDESPAGLGEPPDPLDNRIMQLVKGLPDADKRDILKMAEEKRLLRELINERDKRTEGHN